MRFARSLLAVSALALVVGTSPACATAHVASFTGVVDKTYGLFIEQYIGQIFSGSFRFDTAATFAGFDVDGQAIYSDSGSVIAVLPGRTLGPLGDGIRYDPATGEVRLGYARFGYSAVLLTIARAAGDLTPPTLAEVTSAPLRYQYAMLLGENISGPIRITDVRTVPEPSSWALMIAGFGAIGSLTRLRKQISVRLD